MTRALNQIPGVVAFGETLFWGRFYEPPGADGCYHGDQLERLAARYRSIQLVPVGGVGGLGLTREQSTKVVIDAITSATAPITPIALFSLIGTAVVKATGRESGLTAWVEKTPHHLMHVGRIIEADPTARVIVMLRHPESFLLSYKHIGDLKPAAARNRFHSLYHPLTAAVVCRGYLKALLSAVAQFPENVKVCRFEEITTDFPRAMEEVCRHLNLPSTPENAFPSENTSFDDSRDTPRPVLSPEDRAWLDLLCRRHAAMLGYTLESRNIVSSLTHAVFSGGRLIPWYFRNRQFLASSSTGGIRAILNRWLR